MMRVLDIDLDAFLNDVAYWPIGGRLDESKYIPWQEDRLRDFLECQCNLSSLNPIPGKYIENHDGAFHIFKDLVLNGDTTLDVVHVDGHADLGMGDASWTDMISHVAKPLKQRYTPNTGSKALNLGSWLAYALAAEFISDLTYVYPAGYGQDLQRLYFSNGNTDAGYIELKAFTRTGLPMMSRNTPDYDALCTLKPDKVLPQVPFKMETLDNFKAQSPFDYGLLCQSPDYTPRTSDALIPVIKEYINF